MAHHVDARIDKTDNMFLPPLRTLGFNPQLTMNDSLLVQSYIETYDVSYPEALRMVENDVDELRQHIDAFGEYELNGIGRLSRNEEGSLLFEPCEAGVLTPEYYGLGGFQMPVLDEALAKVETMDADNGSDKKGTHDVLIIKMSWLRNAVAVAAAVIAFLMIGTPVTNSTQQVGGTSQSSFIPVIQQHEPSTASLPSVEEVAVADQTAVASDSINSGNVETEEAVSEETTEAVQQPEHAEVSEPEVLSTEYCIVMASQVSERNALRFIEQLKAQGYNDARMWVNGNRMRRVVYGSFATEADAESTLQQLRSESRLFRDTWITEMK